MRKEISNLKILYKLYLLLILSEPTRMFNRDYMSHKTNYRKIMNQERYDTNYEIKWTK